MLEISGSIRVSDQMFVWSPNTCFGAWVFSNMYIFTNKKGILRTARELTILSGPIKIVRIQYNTGFDRVFSASSMFVLQTVIFTSNYTVHIRRTKSARVPVSYFLNRVIYKYFQSIHNLFINLPTLPRKFIAPTNIVTFIYRIAEHK